MDEQVKQQMNNGFENGGGESKQLKLVSNDPTAAAYGSTGLNMLSDKQQQHDDTPLTPTSGSNSNLMTIMHIIKGCIGPSLLAMPFAFKNGGLLFGAIGLVLITIMIVHTMHILLKCFKYLVLIKKKVPYNESIGYEDVMELLIDEKYKGCKQTLQKGLKILVSTLLVFDQITTATVYLIFVATNVHQVINFYFPQLELNLHLLLTIIAMPLLVFCQIKSLKCMAPFNIFANFLTMISIVIILYDLLFIGQLKPLDQLQMVASVDTWPIFLSLAIYVTDCISVVLPVYHEMREKEKLHPWYGVLNTSMTIIACINLSVGGFGYWKYGQNVESSITLNLPVDNVLYQVVKLFIATATLITYNLRFYVAADILWSYIRPKKVKEEQEEKSHCEGGYCCAEMFFRCALVIFTYVLAILVPRIDLFISLIGSITGTTLLLMIPAMMDHILFYRSCSLSSTFQLLKNFTIFTIGFFVFISGTYVSLDKIIIYMRSSLY